LPTSLTLGSLVTLNRALHPLIGAVVLEDMAQGPRRVAHRRAAELLDGESNGSLALARVATHLLACGPAGDTWVVERLRDRAREALEHGAPEIAVDYVRRALSEPPTAIERAQLLFLLGTAEWHAGRPDAIAHLEAALAAAGDDPSTVIAVCARSASAYNVTDNANRAVEVLDRVLAAVGQPEATAAMIERLGTMDPELPTNAGVALRCEATPAIVGLLVRVRRADGADSVGSC
jgi:hypothetical protein